MKKQLFTTGILLFLGLVIVNGQTSKSIYNVNEIEYLIGTGTNDPNISSMNAIRIRTGIATSITQSMSLGISLGTDAYRNSNGLFGQYFNTLPVVGKLTYFKKQDFSGLNADLYSGYAIRAFSNFEKGLTLGTGIGYNFKSRKHSNFGVKTGYNFQQIAHRRFSNNQLKNLNLHSIRLGVKFILK
jgi:hypothetical protein